jgi:stage IV sporulation protein FB
MEPNQTPYDLRWTMFGVSVRIHPMFWLVTVFMGLSALRMGVQYLLIWVGCVFVSILIHELGHVGMGQAFGSRGHIVLYGFGGLAIGSNQLERRWQRVAVSFAGPLAGFIFLGLVFLAICIWNVDHIPYFVFVTMLDFGVPMDHLDGLMEIRSVPNVLMDFVVRDLVFINLLWGLVNLLPVWPLDGGQISKELCETLSPNRGSTNALGLSMVVAGLLAVHCFLVVIGKQLVPVSMGNTYTAILFAILAVQSFQLMQQVQSQDRWRNDSWDER